MLRLSPLLTYWALHCSLGFSLTFVYIVSSYISYRENNDATHFLTSPAFLVKLSGIVLLPVTFSVCITTKQSHDDIAKGCCQLTCFLWCLSPDFSGLLVSGNLIQKVSPWILWTRKIKKKMIKKKHLSSFLLYRKSFKWVLL